MSDTLKRSRYVLLVFLNGEEMDGEEMDGGVMGDALSLYQQFHAKGVNVIALAEKPAQIPKWLPGILPFPLLHDSKYEVARKYGVNLFPTKVLMAADGRVASVDSDVPVAGESYTRMELETSTTNQK